MYIKIQYTYTTALKIIVFILIILLSYTMSTVYKIG